MNTTSRTITGLAMIVFGAFLLVGSLFWEAWAVSVIYGVLLFFIGWFVLFNKKEDEIEQIKEVKGGKKK
jgi:membrane-bound ClpP family serine protease